MAKPYIHAVSAAKKWGGEPEDYQELHDFMDSSKAVMPDNRHRALTHNSWFIFVCEKVFGTNITNSDGRKVSVRDICERHVLEDFGNKFIPSPQDYLEHMEFQGWMNNGIEGCPASYKKIAGNKTITRTELMRLD